MFKYAHAHTHACQDLHARWARVIKRMRVNLLRQANEEDRRPYRREKDLDKKRNKAKGKSNDTHGYTHALTNGTHRDDVSADYATLQRAHAETATCVACITFAECGNTSPLVPTVTSRSSHPAPRWPSVPLPLPFYRTLLPFSIMYWCMCECISHTCVWRTRPSSTYRTYEHE